MDNTVIMRTTVQTIDALRSARSTVLRDWLADAKTQWKHLDTRLFARNGALLAGANATLDALEAFHQSHEEEDRFPECPLASSSENEVLLPPVASQAPFPAFTQAAEAWAALPVSWPNLTAMVRRLAWRLNAALMEKRVESLVLDLNTALFESLIAAGADLRVTQLEKDLASDREETVMTQHLAGRFLANASHELRTPLTAVLGFAELLLEETYGDLTPEQRTAVGHINDSAQNLLEIVNNLLDLLHIRTGKFTLRYHSTEIAPLLQNIYDILVALAQRKKVRFFLDLPEELGAIEMDENIVRHSVYHLLASALRSTPADGAVTLSARREPQRLIILTHDTALHLPPEAIANMMSPFPLLENSPVRGYEGWEVGLPLVRRYVDLHGGELEMESLPDQGTTFRIVLPTTRPDRRRSA